MVPRATRRCDLDGAVLPAVVRRHGQMPGSLSLLQRRQPRPTGTPGMSFPKIDVDSSRLSREIEQLARFSDAECEKGECPPILKGTVPSVALPAVTRVLFTQADLDARAFLKNLFAGA